MGRQQHCWRQCIHHHYFHHVVLSSTLVVIPREKCKLSWKWVCRYLFFVNSWTKRTFCIIHRHKAMPQANIIFKATWSSVEWQRDCFEIEPFNVRSWWFKSCLVKCKCNVQYLMSSQAGLNAKCRVMLRRKVLSSLSHLYLLPSLWGWINATQASHLYVCSAWAASYTEKIWNSALSKLKMIIHLICLPLPLAHSVRLMWNTQEKAVWAAHAWLNCYNNLLWKCGKKHLQGFCVWYLLHLKRGKWCASSKCLY